MNTLSSFEVRANTIVTTIRIGFHLYFLEYKSKFVYTPIERMNLNESEASRL